MGRKVQRTGTVLSKLSVAQERLLRQSGLVFGCGKNGKWRVDAWVAKLIHRHGK
jgi:hypothetical protein